MLTRATVIPIGPPPAEFKEPSGITYHALHASLFAVGDHGDAIEMTRDGKVLQRQRLHKHLDIEGVTVGPGGRLFVIVEHDLVILEVDPAGLKIERQWQIIPEFASRDVISRDPNKGLEGLCFVPDEAQFCAISQAKPSLLVKLDLLRPDGLGSGVHITEIVADLKSIVGVRASDLCLDATSSNFLLIESDHGRGRGALYELTRAGVCLGRAKLPGHDQEGLAIDDQGSLFIAQDSGGFLRVDISQ